MTYNNSNNVSQVENAILYLAPQSMEEGNECECTSGRGSTQENGNSHEEKKTKKSLSTFQACALS